MPDVREVYEMVTKQRPPTPGALERQWDKQRRTARNRKTGAFAVAAAVVVVVAMIAFAATRADDRSGVEPLDRPTLGASVPPETLEPDAQDVAVVDLDGNPVAQIPNVPEDAYALSVSPDRTTVAFVTSEGTFQPQIATILVDGTGLRILPTDVPATTPAWSPDGDRIVFVGTVDFQDDVFVMEADGSSVRRVTTDDADEIYPRWSPDGETIVYTNVGDHPYLQDPQYSKTADIWTIRAAGGTPTQLTSTPGPDAHPDFSPDGSRIAYFHDGSIGLMDADGLHQGTLVRSGLGGFTPRWSPDGSLIAYTDYDDSYKPMVSIDGSTLEFALVSVHVVDPVTGRHHAVGDVGMATDFNVPVWWSNDRLLIRRVGH